MLALFLGLIVSAGLYFAYLWPQVEPVDVEAEPGPISEGATGASTEGLLGAAIESSSERAGTGS